MKPKTGPRYVKYVLVEDYVPPEERQEEITGRRERKKPRVSAAAPRSIMQAI